MSSRKYDIHGLVEVLISDSVRPEVVREIDFQIGAFRDLKSASSQNEIPKIYIGPYADRKDFGKDSREALFYQCKGVVGKYVKNNDERLFVGRDANAFYIYADYANFLINLYIQLLIVGQGFTMVHAAAYRSSSGAINVLTGAGGIGKTAVLGYAVSELGLPHLGDDIVILGRDGSCLAFPREFVLKSYHKEIYAKVFEEMRLPRWNLYRLKRFIVDNAPFIGFTKKILKRFGYYYQVANRLRPQPFLATISSDELFGQGSMIKAGGVGRVAYIDRVSEASSFAMRKIAPEVLVNRCVSVIHYEWKDFMTHLVTLGALNVGDVADYFENVVEVFRQVVAKAEHVQVDVPESATPQELIDFLANEGFF